MPRACTICVHHNRAEIEAAVIAGVSYRVIARQFSVGHDAIQRHAASHIRESIQEVIAQQEEQSAFDALSEMDWMRNETRGIYNEVRQIKDYRFALQALAELRRQNELCAKLVGELDEHSITITAIPEWRELRALLLDALAQHPQAKMAVIRALEAYDHEQTA